MWLHFIMREGQIVEAAAQIYSCNRSVYYTHRIYIYLHIIFSITGNFCLSRYMFLLLWLYCVHRRMNENYGFLEIKRRVSSDVKTAKPSSFTFWVTYIVYIYIFMLIRVNDLTVHLSCSSNIIRNFLEISRKVWVLDNII